MTGGRRVKGPQGTDPETGADGSGSPSRSQPRRRLTVPAAVALGLDNAAANLWKAPPAWRALPGSLIGYELAALLLAWAFDR